MTFQQMRKNLLAAYTNVSKVSYIPVSQKRKR